MKRRKRILLFASLALLLASACTSTVTPTPVEATQASYDGGSQTSGVIGVVTAADGVASGWVVTSRARERYNALVERYGAVLWTPAICEDYGVTPAADGHYYMTDEAMAKFVAMAEKARMTGE